MDERGLSVHLPGTVDPVAAIEPSPSSEAMLVDPRSPDAANLALEMLSPRTEVTAVYATAPDRLGGLGAVADRLATDATAYVAAENPVASIAEADVALPVEQARRERPIPLADGGAHRVTPVANPWEDDHPDTSLLAVTSAIPGAGSTDVVTTVLTHGLDRDESDRAFELYAGLYDYALDDGATDAHVTVADQRHLGPDDDPDAFVEESTGLEGVVFGPDRVPDAATVDRLRELGVSMVAFQSYHRDVTIDLGERTVGMRHTGPGPVDAESVPTSLSELLDRDEERRTTVSTPVDEVGTGGREDDGDEELDGGGRR